MKFRAGRAVLVDFSLVYSEFIQLFVYVSFVRSNRLSCGGCKWTEEQMCAHLHQQSKLIYSGLRY